MNCWVMMMWDVLLWTWIRCKVRCCLLWFYVVLIILIVLFFDRGIMMGFFGYFLVEDFVGVFCFFDRFVNLEVVVGCIHGFSLDVMRGLVEVMGDL